MQVGQHTDSRAFFTGAIDEVRVRERALTDEELAVGGTRTRNTVLWLPMDPVSNRR